MSVLTLADAKLHLNITKTVNDVELQAVIDAAEAAIAKRVGPLASTSVTSVVQGCTDMLILPVNPVMSLTSVTPVSSSSLDVTGLVADTAGIVTYKGWGYFPARTYTVTYSAGRASVTADLLLAVKELVRHLWGPQRGSGIAPGQADAAPSSMPGFSFPNRVLELLANHQQVGV